MGLPTPSVRHDAGGVPVRRRPVRTFRRLWSLALAIGCLAVPSSTYAQETVNYASVSGRVTDAQGAVVPGAQVVARQIETDVKAETVTSTDGRFRFPYLRVGSYEVRVSLQGF